MPAVVRRRGDKFRVVEKSSGQLVKRGGSAVDGGGHRSKARALAQASAINIPKRKRRRS